MTDMAAIKLCKALLKKAKRTGALQGTTYEGVYFVISPGMTEEEAVETYERSREEAEKLKKSVFGT